MLSVATPAHSVTYARPVSTKHSIGTVQTCLFVLVHCNRAHCIH